MICETNSFVTIDLQYGANLTFNKIQLFLAENKLSIPCIVIEGSKTEATVFFPRQVTDLRPMVTCCLKLSRS